MITFSGYAASAGFDDLVLPILYTNVKEITDGIPADEVMVLVSKRQWIDWRDLRLEDENSPKYRQAINGMALRLAEILENFAGTAPIAEREASAAEIEDEPGLVEKLALMEEATPRWTAVIQEYGAITNQIGELMAQGKDQIDASDARGGGFSGRLHVSRTLAEQLKVPVDRMAELAVRYSSELLDIDPGMISLIRQAKNTPDSNEAAAFGEFLATIKELIAGNKASMASLEGFKSSAADVAKTSSQMRPLMQSINASSQRVLDCRTVLDGWERLIDEEHDA